MKTILIAVGGNSLIRAGEKGTVAEQLANARRTAAQIVGLCADGHRIVLTHGNGPQVGAALLRSERGASEVPGHPLDVCGACSQGEIGYLLEQSIETELQKAGLHVPVVTLLTQSVVSADDPAMKRPEKPVGPFYSQAEAEARRRQFGWQIVEDASRGYRRVVPSPEPIEIVELEVIRDLVQQNVLVIACGGGGIPVLWRDGALVGVEAVIDKDRASALLAAHLDVDLFLISTDAEYVYLDFKKPTQRPLQRISASELQKHSAAGHFPPGNMGPKVESVLRFLRGGGKEAIITSCDRLREAVAGSAGTHILANSEIAGIPLKLDLELPVGGR
jgi:carbamate kinase